jgi:DNA-binding transcriptional regulator YiaG
MKNPKQISSLAAEMIAGLSEFCDALEAGIPMDDRFTVRTVTLDLTPRSYNGNDVMALRKRLKASQAIFAKFLGVSVSAR